MHPFLADLSNAAFKSMTNSFLIGAAVISSAAVACAINQIANKIFSIKEGSFASWASKTLAFSMGTLTSLYLFSKVTIADIPTGKGIALILIPGLNAFLTPGAVIGMLNLTARSIVWIGLGAAGAFLGAFASSNNV